MKERDEAARKYALKYWNQDYVAKTFCDGYDAALESEVVRKVKEENVELRNSMQSLVNTVDLYLSVRGMTFGHREMMREKVNELLVKYDFKKSALKEFEQAKAGK